MQQRGGACTASASFQYKFLYVAFPRICTVYVFVYLWMLNELSIINIIATIIVIRIAFVSFIITVNILIITIKILLFPLIPNVVITIVIVLGRYMSLSTPPQQQVMACS